MKMFNLILAGVLLAGCFAVTDSCLQKAKSGTTSVIGVFAASTPCNKGTRPLPGISVNTGCEFIR